MLLALGLVSSFAASVGCPAGWSKLPYEMPRQHTVSSVTNADGSQSVTMTTSAPDKTKVWCQEKETP